MEPLAVDVREAAHLLSVSPFTIRAWIRQERIRALKLGARIAVPMAEVRRIAAEGLPTKIHGRLRVQA